MDKLAIKKGLFAGMGDFAKQMRMEQLRKKYAKGGLSDEMAEVAAGQDNAAEEAKLPDVDAMGKKPMLSVTIAPAGEEDADMESMANDIEKKKLSRMYGEK
jgi:hypothetical protein